MRPERVTALRCVWLTDGSVVGAEAGFRDEAWALTDYSAANAGTFALMGEPVAWLLAGSGDSASRR